jgi:hypothetical protein
MVLRRVGEGGRFIEGRDYVKRFVRMNHDGTAESLGFRGVGRLFL